MARLFFASLVTFGILVGMVIGCVLAMVYMGEVDFTLAIVPHGHHQSRDLAGQPVALRSHASLVQQARVPRRSHGEAALSRRASTRPSGG